MIISQRVQFDVTALAFDDQYPPELKDKFSKEEFTDIVHTCSLIVHQKVNSKDRKIKVGMALFLLGFLTLVIGIGLLFGALGLYLMLLGGIGETHQYLSAMEDVKAFLAIQNKDLEPDGIQIDLQYEDDKHIYPYLDLIIEYDENNLPPPETVHVEEQGDIDYEEDYEDEEDDIDDTFNITIPQDGL